MPKIGISATTASADTALSPGELMLDHKNPRLVDYLESRSRPSQDDILRVLWEEMAVDELVLSIAKSGYLPFEPLLVAKEEGKWVVIEGNRRVAAVKILLDRDKQKLVNAFDVPALTANVRATLAKLPVIVTSRQGSWQYLGVKHINGPKRWDSYAKAQYIASVEETQKVTLKTIAERIGDKHKTVQRLYRALKVVEQAEEAKVFHRENRAKKHFAFSHLYTGLDYPNIAAFIGLKSESDESNKPVRNSHVKQLGEFCVWLFGDSTRDIEPVIASQNPDLKNLESVLGSPKAIEALRAKLPLSVALEVSFGDERIFSDALYQAKNMLQKARATISTGFTGGPEQRQLAVEILDLATDLHDEVERKGSSKAAKKGTKRK